jgi:hypothetical protein
MAPSNAALPAARPAGLDGPAVGPVPDPVPAWAPPLRLQLLNFAVFQAAWTAAVLGAAGGWPLLGVGAVAAALAWHLSRSARPGQELRLALAVTAVGLVFETLRLPLRDTVYPSGQPLATLPPYWLITLWTLMAISLNVTLRWLRGRLALAMGVGALGGPLAFLGGERLGGAQFTDPSSALTSLALGWALLMPLLVALAQRFDGVTPPEPVSSLDPAPMSRP